MSDLTEFLLARIAEDEALARSVEAPLPIQGMAPVSLSSLGKTVGIQIAPSRVLAECNAKRLMVGNPEHRGGMMYEYFLRCLAKPYAAHPDYDEAWRA